MLHAVSSTSKHRKVALTPRFLVLEDVVRLAIMQSAQPVTEQPIDEISPADVSPRIHGCCPVQDASAAVLPRRPDVRREPQVEPARPQQQQLDSEGWPRDQEGRKSVREGNSARLGSVRRRRPGAERWASGEQQAYQQLVRDLDMRNYCYNLYQRKELRTTERCPSICAINCLARPRKVGRSGRR